MESLHKYCKNKKREKIFAHNTLLMFFILSFFPNLSSGQTSYILGKYKINPTEQKIWVSEFFSETINGGGHAWGEKYVLDSTINYNNTTLFLIGNQFVFKEDISKNGHFPPQLDFNSLKVINIDVEEYGGSLCRDKNFLYRNSIGIEQQSKWESISLYGYKTINDFVYQKDNDLYFLSRDFELKKIENLKLDVSTLVKVMGNYFTDKNGLYLLGGYSTREFKAEKTETGLVIYRKEWESFFHNESIQLEKKNKRTQTTPIIKTDYFIYNAKVYSPRTSNSHLPLPLNSKEMVELEIKNNSYANYTTNFLADNDHTFVSISEKGGYVTLEARYGNQWFVGNDFFEKNVNQWEVISRGDLGLFKGKDGNLYFPNQLKQTNRDNYAGIVVHKQKEFYDFELNENSTLTKFDKVFIFNFDIKEYEELDPTQFRYLYENFWIYKNRLYMYSSGVGLPIKELMDNTNLYPIKHHDKKTNFLINKNSLVYIGKFGGTSTLGEGLNTVQVFGNRIISNVDFSSLKVITADVLKDDENIYIGKYDGISIIPIKSLGLNINILTE